MHKILVLIDFSAASANSLKYAHRISKAFGMPLSLLYCYAPEVYNRRFDFGDKNYDAGIKEMLLNFYEKHLEEKPEKLKVIARSGPVSEGVKAISGDFKLLILSSGNFSSKIQRWASSRTSAILSNAKCPVLIVPTGKNHSDWNTVWHIQKNENEFHSMKKYLPVFKLREETIAVKTFKQTTFQSALWKSMFFYLKSHEAIHNKNIMAASAKEEIDLALVASAEKGNFERYKTVEILQLLIQSNIPVMVFKTAP